MGKKTNPNIMQYINDSFNAWDSNSRDKYVLARI